MQASVLSRGNGAVFNIEVYADTICPWCYVGTRFLHKAVAALPGASFRLKWRPYMIAPDISDKGQCMREYMQTRYGKAVDLDDPESPLARAAAAAGVQFTASDSSSLALNGSNQKEGAATSGLLSRHIWNSAASHALIALAGEEERRAGQRPGAGRLGLQTEVADAIFTTYFEHNRNIADKDVLLEVAARAGLQADAVHAALNSAQVSDLSAAFKAGAKSKGVQGVPFFIISREGYPGSYRFTGAQPPQVFTRAFESLLVDRDQLITMLRSKVGAGSRTGSPSVSSCNRSAGGASPTSASEQRPGTAQFLSRAKLCSTLHRAAPSSHSTSSEGAVSWPSSPRKRSRQSPSPRRAGGAQLKIVGDADIQEAAEALSCVRTRATQQAATASPPPAPHSTPRRSPHSSTARPLSRGSGAGLSPTVAGTCRRVDGGAMRGSPMPPVEHCETAADAVQPMSPHKRLRLFKEGYGCSPRAYSTLSFPQALSVHPGAPTAVYAMALKTQAAGRCSQLASAPLLTDDRDHPSDYLCRQQMAWMRPMTEMPRGRWQ